MVRYNGSILGRGLCGADIHVPVYLAAVGVDDLAAETLGKVKGQGTFANGGGAYNEEDGCLLSNRRPQVSLGL